EDSVCSDELWVPQLGIAQKLQPFATTVIEIPPTAAGSYSMTCQMGMMSGALLVGDGGGGAPSLLPVLGALAIAGILLALWRTQPRPAACGSDARSDASTSGAQRQTPGTTVLGLAPEELVVVAALLVAAVIAGLALGGAIGS
ncbi:MAG TPA: cupredoxin domain-containing protein, partial [Coriobacteriia bacterium]|nr:cupredoxin domain-containing protein [Coriobacteriia bacterium]